MVPLFYSSAQSRAVKLAKLWQTKIGYADRRAKFAIASVDYLEKQLPILGLGDCSDLVENEDRSPAHSIHELRL